MLEYFDAYVVAFVLSFLLGSIPFGVIVSKLFYKKDLRDQGSGNIGTTNAIRTMGKVGGFSVFLLDFGKGILSGIVSLCVGSLFLELHGESALAPQLFQQFVPFAFGPVGDSSTFLVSYYQVLISLSFLGCILGHVFSPWLKFKGGKGVAVAVGCLFVAFGIIGASLELLLFTILVVSTRYVSFGSIIAALSCPFFALFYFWGNPAAIILCGLGGLTVVWAHRDNIGRLLSKTERRVGDK